MESTSVESMKPSHTCLTCLVLFARTDLQREHYKCEWHRYNLKRKVANMPPISAELFQKKALLFQNEDATNATERNDERHFCDCCRKLFNSNHALENHLQSKKHKIAFLNDDKKSGEPCLAEKIMSSNPTKTTDFGEDSIDDDDDDSEIELDTDGLSVNECLFCANRFLSLDLNLEHMGIAHGFFVPDLEYCTDLERLIGYLGRKVGSGYMCLWCNSHGKMFRSVDAVQKHMRDKQHCKLLFEGESTLEYCDFYDYSSSYPDAPSVDADEPVDVPEVLTNTNWQLILPSGCTVGHRSLMRYYRQRLKPIDKQLVPAGKANVHGILDCYKKLGWTGATGAAAARRAKDIRFVQRLHARQSLQLGVGGNKLQRYFKRDDIRSKAL